MDVEASVITKVIKSHKTAIGDMARVSIPHSETGFYIRMVYPDGHIEFYPYDPTKARKKFDNHPTPTKNFNTGAKTGMLKKKREVKEDD